MNQRILELVEKAPYTTVSTEGRLFTQQDLAKFAELIVRECCTALRPMLRDQISRGHGATLIKEHFGVAE